MNNPAQLTPEQRQQYEHPRVPRARIQAVLKTFGPVRGLLTPVVIARMNARLAQLKDTYRAELLRQWGITEETGAAHADRPG